MSDLNLIKPEKVQNIINKFCYTIGMIPTSYKVSLTYEEQIDAIGHYLETTVYPAMSFSPSRPFNPALILANFFLKYTEASK